MYAVVTQETQVNQALVCAKAQLAKQGLIMPRKELISLHMVVKLLDIVCDFQCHLLLTVALQHCITLD